MKRTLLIILLLLFSIEVCSSQTECEKILSKEINLTFSEKSDLDILNNTFSKLTDCGLEQIDANFFSNGPMLATLLVPLISENDGKVTYQNLFDKIIELKKNPKYAETIELFGVSQDLFKRKTDIKNWENDKVLFDKIKTPSDLIEKIHLLVQQNSNPNRTYAQLFKDLENENSRQNKKKNVNKKEYNIIFKNAGNVNYEDLLKKSIDLDRPLLLYFTGYACANCKKMEHSILSDESIESKLINEFYFINLYVDDKKSLPENEWTESKINGKLIKRIGQKHSELQFNKFNNNYQPYFVIINKDGIKIAEQNYTKDKKVFEDFLNTVK